LLPPVLALADEAGRSILATRAHGLGATAKPDGSPVTEADRNAERLIVARLRALTPRIPVIAEEGRAEGTAPEPVGEMFWLVDPLDGTREMLAGRDEFTVNIALIIARRPVLGVVTAPALDRAWWGSSGQGACRRAAGSTVSTRARQAPSGETVACASRSHRDASTDAWLAERGITRINAIGSSLKFCLIAQGEADVYPRFGRTMEWDTAAGHAILAAAGGRVETLDGKSLTYGKPGFVNPAFIAFGAAGRPC
jgi:3'(2'), 5'-bisphosphate nucleotidase